MFTDLIFTILPIEPHPLACASYHRFFCDGEQAIEPDAKGSNFALVWVSLSNFLELKA